MTALQGLQREYAQAVATYDPQAIAHFVRRYPFHADSLLQLVRCRLCFLSQHVCAHCSVCVLQSHLYETQSEYAGAQELIERCLFLYECALHPEFSLSEASRNPAAPCSAVLNVARLAQGNCRLSFDVDSNAGFFKCLARYAQLLGKKVSCAGAPSLLLSLTCLVDLCFFSGHRAVRARLWSSASCC